MHLPRRVLSFTLLAVLTTSLVAARPAGRPAGPPADFIAAADRLSQPEYPETVRETFEVPMHDGELLYVEVVRPDPEVYGDLQLPVVMEASPYHGTVADRSGTRIFPDPIDADGNKIGLTGFFAPRGYAVVMVDLRGTGRSGGCLDHLGPNDAKDLKDIVEWAAGQEWSSGKVGMTGHSYVGSTPSVAAAQRPDGLATIVPSAGLASMYDHQFQKGVPYNLQYIGPMVAYEGLALDRHLPPGSPSALGENTGDDFGNNVDDTGCGLPNSAALAGTGQVTGQYELWHAQRDHRQGAADADIPVFMIHGVNDNAARIPAAEWFFGERFARPGDKVWVGQWDHGSTNGRCGDEGDQRILHPTCRLDQFQYALLAWFDKHLKGKNVDTGPAVEAFLNPDENLDLSVPRDPESVAGPVFTARSWERPTSPLELYLDASEGALVTTPPTEAASVSFESGRAALFGSGGSAVFTSQPFEKRTVFVGLPSLEFTASTTTQLNHLVVTLYNESPDGARSPANTCAINPLLRYGVESLAPVVPGEQMALDATCFTMAHQVPAGHRLVVEISTDGPHHVEYGGDASITIHTGPDHGSYRLPTVQGKLHRDVALRE